MVLLAKKPNQEAPMSHRSFASTVTLAAVSLFALLLQMPAGKFERDELMMVVRLARGRQRFVRNCVVAGIARKIIAPRLALRADSSAAFEI